MFDRRDENAGPAATRRQMMIGATALGLAAGGVAGGWLAQHHGQVSVFVFGSALVALWLLFAAGMKAPPRRSSQPPAAGQAAAASH